MLYVIDLGQGYIEKFLVFVFLVALKTSCLIWQLDSLSRITNTRQRSWKDQRVLQSFEDMAYQHWITARKDSHQLKANESCQSMTARYCRETMRSSATSYTDYLGSLQSTLGLRHLHRFITSFRDSTFINVAYTLLNTTRLFQGVYFRVNTDIRKH